MKKTLFFITTSLLLMLNINFAFASDNTFELYQIGQKISKEHQKDTLCENFYLKAFPKPTDCTKTSKTVICTEYYKYLNEFCEKYPNGLRVNYLLNKGYAKQFCTNDGYNGFSSYSSTGLSNSLINDKNNVYYFCSNTNISSCKILDKNYNSQDAYIKKITCKEHTAASLIASKITNNNKTITTTTTANNKTITTTSATTNNNSTTNKTTSTTLSSTTPKYTCTRSSNSAIRKKDGVTIQTKSDECVSGKIHQAYCNGNEIASGYKLVPCAYGCSNTSKACNQFECNSNYGSGSNACRKEKPRCIANKCQACSATQVYSEVKRTCVQCDTNDTSKCKEGQVCQNNLCKDVYTCKKEGKSITKYLNGKQNGQIINDKCSGNNVMIYSCSKEESIGSSITITAKTTYCANGCDSSTLSCKEKEVQKESKSNNNLENNNNNNNTKEATTTTTTTANKNATTNNLNTNSTNSTSSTFKIQQSATTGSASCNRPYLHVSQCTKEIEETTPQCISFVLLCDSCKGDMCERYIDIKSDYGKKLQDELLNKGYGQLGGYGKGNRFFPPQFYGIAPAYYIPTPAPVVYSKTPQLLPRLECVTDNGDGTMTAYFGYENKTDKTIEIKVGDKREGYKNSIEGNVLSEINFEANIENMEKSVLDALNNLDDETIMEHDFTKEDIQNLVNNMYQNMTYVAYKNASTGKSTRHITKFLPGVHKGIIQVVFRKANNNQIKFTLQNDKEKITTATADLNSPLCKDIKPQFECIKGRNPFSQEALAIFGYKNENDFPIYIPVGKNNQISSNSPKSTRIANLGQTTQFLPGTQNTVFAAPIKISDENQTWYLSVKDNNTYNISKIDASKNTCKNNECMFVSILSIKNSIKNQANDYINFLTLILNQVDAKAYTKKLIETKINKFLKAIQDIKDDIVMTCPNSKNCSLYTESYQIENFKNLFQDVQNTVNAELSNIKNNDYCNNNVMFRPSSNVCPTCVSNPELLNATSHNLYTEDNEYRKIKVCQYILSNIFANDVNKVHHLGNTLFEYLNIFNEPTIKNRSFCYSNNN